MNGAEWIADKLNAPGKFKGITATIVDQDIVLLNREEKPNQFIGVVSLRQGGVQPLISLEMVQAVVNREAKIVFLVAIPKIARWSGAAIDWLRTKGIAFGGVGDLFSATLEPLMSNYRDKERAFVEDGLGQHSCVEEVVWLEDRLLSVSLGSGVSVTIALCNEYDITMAAARVAAKTFGEFDVLLKTNPNGSITSNGADEVGVLGFQTLKWGELLGFLAKRGGSSRSRDLRKRLQIADEK